MSVPTESKEIEGANHLAQLTPSIIYLSRPIQVIPIQVILSEHEQMAATIRALQQEIRLRDETVSELMDQNQILSMQLHARDREMMELQDDLERRDDVIEQLYRDRDYGNNEIEKPSGAQMLTPPLSETASSSSLDSDDFELISLEDSKPSPEVSNTFLPSYGQKSNVVSDSVTSVPEPSTTERPQPSK